ncbi:uncharacterized protein LOC128990066 [Macrosteles quadrilineatus]|uniref:uncharacterized protein LOC128990066 n=1 Tax=Macrosteles quadrilineatus TaxID=74068 RepID=UPI0023E2E293|nr:uncharacterized protein LOC128990066 [Macrosteles quadrilineatus]
MAARHPIPITLNSCPSAASCIWCIYLIISIVFIKDYECKVTLAKRKKHHEEYDNRAWRPALPFIGASYSYNLMGQGGGHRDWDSTQFQDKALDNVFKMGRKREELGTLWSGDTVLQEEWHPHWQLQVSLIALVCGLALFLVVLIWLKNQMSSSSSTGSDKVEIGDESLSHSEGQWIYHPVIKPVTTEQCEILPIIPHPPHATRAILPEVMTAHNLTEEKKEPIRIKAKGLLERRGSSASLTIDLLHPSQENLSVTPTRECTAEEYLLSVGNVLSRGQLRNCLKDARALHKEFWDLPLNHPEKIEITGSSAKNRYRTIIPNENTRVHLPLEPPSDPLSGYINANYIRGYDGEEKAFIATQGPLTNTVVDFWRMVWSEHSPVIVMITKLMEKSRSKCELYFPIDPGATETYGDISVTVSSIIVKDGYVIRHFIMQKEDETQRVTHFWFDSWPDHKTPANAHSLLCLAKDVESYRFRDTQRGSTSSWPHSPKPVKSDGTKHETDLLSPCPEAASPQSLKETSPVLNFGRLEFKEDEPEKELRSSPKSGDENLIVLAQEDVTEPVQISLKPTVEALNLEIFKEVDETAYKIVPVLPADKLNSPTFYDRSLYSNDDVFQVGSLPQKSPIQSRVQLENIRSRSVEAPSSGSLKSDSSQEKKSAPGEIFDFEKLTIWQDTNTMSTDELTSSEERKKSSDISENLPESFEKKFKGIGCTSSPNWASEASPNLTQSFDKSTSKLSVDSLSWGGLDVMSPNFSEKSPNRTQSSIESPVTHSSSDSKRWPRSSDSSKQWTRSSQGSSGWAQSSEDSPRWFEKDEESHIRTPRDWFDKSPLLSRRSREGSVSFLWNEVPAARGPAAGPVIVHCSAGIGRTGCFIAICVGVNQLLGENNVDILGIVCRMRYDRGGMVQTAEQYEFIHRALALFERSLPDQSGE